MHTVTHYSPPLRAALAQCQSAHGKGKNLLVKIKTNSFEGRRNFIDLQLLKIYLHSLTGMLGIKLRIEYICLILISFLD